MKYNNTLFSKMNTVTYNNKETKDFFVGFDISNISKSADFFMDYFIESEDNIDLISYKIYGDISYYWTILLVNNIQDALFDLPLNSDEIKKITKSVLENKIAYKLLTAQSDKDKYISDNFYVEFIKQEDINNKKRHIKVVRPELINKFISTLERT